MKLNKYIDHTLLKPDASFKEIEKLCHEAIDFKNLTSSTVAPDLLKPVEVFTKLAFAVLIQSHAMRFSSFSNKHVSIITFSVCLPHAFLISVISLTI